MVCRGDLSDINGPLRLGGLVGPDCSTLLHDASRTAVVDGAAVTDSTPLTPSDQKRRNVVGIGQLGYERTCSTKKEHLMTSPTTIRSPYVQRLELVRDTITSHSKLGDKAASELAEHVLQALNSIPEKVR
jgi:uncharacterized protein DUF6307